MFTLKSGLGSACTVGAALCLIGISPKAAEAAQPSSCNLGSGIQHIVEIQFDNVHFRRDNPNVASDLEQIPSLLNFLESQGTLLTNHHTPLISHTSVDILTTLTGVYGEKMGMPIGNSIVYYNPDGSTSFTSSFAYWTDNLGTTSVPQMVDQRGKIHPAPWVAFTRAGCDVGAFSVANIEFENVGSDVDTVFGPTSPQHSEAQSNKTLAAADFEGIAIHCAKGSALCAANGYPDALKDEPWGYTGFNALFGNKYVAPAITGGQPGVLDLNGNTVADSHGNPGFPGFSPTPAQTLGYLAQMLEAGVPVVYGYIEDAHDNHTLASDPDGTFGPGEEGYVNQLKAYDAAFAAFFARLAQDGITADNTLFVITADENDHFVGGAPTPANCDGITLFCTYAIKGEVQGSLSLLLNVESSDTTPVNYDFDDAPGIWINNHEGDQTGMVTRTLEHHVAGLMGFDPVVGTNTPLTKRLADQTEQGFLHMVTSDPNRTPNFVLFADPDYYLTTQSPAPKSCTPPPLSTCFAETRNFAWNHGNYENDIVRTWLGMVGPGVRHQGATDALLTDHTDVRPTVLSLAGLTDDYSHDGRVIFEILNDGVLPQGLKAHQETLRRLAAAYKNINAPTGPLGIASLGIATQGIEGTDAQYAAWSASLQQLTAARNVIAQSMNSMLEDAAFGSQTLDEQTAKQLIDAANNLLANVGP
jgi:hypothetical protein